MKIAFSLNVSFEQENIEILKPLGIFLMGVFAATIANSTGAGGGIVFLPVFMSLGFSVVESLATSFAIQCFGMTSGSLSWMIHAHKEKSYFRGDWEQLYPILLIASVSSSVGLLVSQAYFPRELLNIELLFSIFSLLIGLFILYRTIGKKNELGKGGSLGRKEIIRLVAVSVVGGAITALLSIGVGELLAIYLIWIGYRVNFSIAIAVCVTAVNVLMALPYYVFQHPMINFSLLLFVAPGALIGGYFANRLTLYLGAYRVKIFISLWIILSACIYFLTSI
jgi:uncharacterized membrane protein YfcA